MRTQRFILLLCFLLLYRWAPGQDLDSLKLVAGQATEDTVRVQALLNLASKIRRSDPSAGISYSYRALQLSDRIGYKTGMMDACYRISVIHKQTGNIDSSEHYAGKLMLLAREAKDEGRLGDGYFQMAGILNSRGETASAMDNYYLAVAQYQIAGDTRGLVACYNGMGSIHRIRTAYDSSILYYTRALRISTENGFETAIPPPMINLGKVYGLNREYEKAEEFTLRGIELTRKDSNLYLMAIAYANLGVIKQDQHQYDSALHYYGTALDLNLRIDNLYGINNAYNNIGSLYFDIGQPQNALQNFERAYAEFRRIDYVSGMITALINRAVIHADLREYEAALALYDTCVLLASGSEDLGKLREVYRGIYQTYEKSGNYRKAFESLYRFHALHDSIFSLEKEELIQDYSARYEHEKLRATILEQDNQILLTNLKVRKRTNQRNIYLFTGMGLLMAAAFLLVFFRHKARKDRIIADQKILQLEEEKKLLAARAIVEGQENERKRIAKELHDGLGVLLSAARMQFTSIRDTSPGNSEVIDRAARLLEQAAGDVRKISHNMMPGLLTRYGFFEAVEDLFERLDESEQMHMKCEITGETGRMPENTEIMLYRIIQELVNNTLKHAEAKHIALSLATGPGKLTMNYRDDGKGFDLEEQRRSRSIGLTSIESRVNFLNGSLSVDTAPGRGTFYSMTIPVELIPDDEAED